MSSPFFYDPSFLHILAPCSIFVFYLFLAHFCPRFPSTSPPPLYPFSPLHCFIFISSPPLFPLTRFLPSSLLVHSLCFYIPLLLLVVLGSVHQAYWHMLVVDEFCHDYTHTHTRKTHAYVPARTDLLEMVVDEQCQTLSIRAYQSCSRNLIRPPVRSMVLASVLANPLLFSFFALRGIWRPSAMHFSTPTIISSDIESLIRRLFSNSSIWPWSHRRSLNWCECWWSHSPQWSRSLNQWDEPFCCQATHNVSQSTITSSGIS